MWKKSRERNKLPRAVIRCCVKKKVSQECKNQKLLLEDVKSVFTALVPWGGWKSQKLGPKRNICVFQVSALKKLGMVRTFYFIKIFYIEISLFITFSSLLQQIWQYLGPVKRICVFEHSVMTNFNCACPAIQRSHGSGFLSEGSSWLTACMSEQRRFWRDCADAQARLNLRCSHRR